MNDTAQILLTPQADPSSPPLATLKGQAIVDLPKDLYIPPDAMKVFLEAFEGPLDFLLYLIRKQNLDILDIPIAEVTLQYMEYIDLMKNLSLELAAEYLVMAAILAEIKSRMLLPCIAEETVNEEDPRAELVRRLQDYERYKQASIDIDILPRQERDTFPVEINTSTISVEKPLPKVVLPDLVHALLDVLKRLKLTTNHQVQLDNLSMQEKMAMILERLQSEPHVLFSSLFKTEEGKLGVVVTFLSMLELLKQHMIEFTQAAPFSPIYLHSKVA